MINILLQAQKRPSSSVNSDVSNNDGEAFQFEQNLESNFSPASDVYTTTSRTLKKKKPETEMPKDGQVAKKPPKRDANLKARANFSKKNK